MWRLLWHFRTPACVTVGLSADGGCHEQVNNVIVAGGDENDF